MSNYAILFGLSTFAALLFAMYYNEFVLFSKVKKIELANEFRYARNLNTELICLFRKYEPMLQTCGNIVDGANYDILVADLQAWHDEIYTDKIYKILIGKEQKANRTVINDLQAAIFEQVKIQHQVKDALKSVLTQKSLAAA
jgi:hypothetical protein